MFKAITTQGGGQVVATADPLSGDASSLQLSYTGPFDTNALSFAVTNPVDMTAFATGSLEFDMALGPGSPAPQFMGACWGQGTSNGGSSCEAAAIPSVMIAPTSISTSFQHFAVPATSFPGPCNGCRVLAGIGAEFPQGGGALLLGDIKLTQ